MWPTTDKQKLKSFIETKRGSLNYIIRKKIIETRNEMHNDKLQKYNHRREDEEEDEDDTLLVREITFKVFSLFH